MLRGMFDTLDEASYVESKDALLQLLQTRVWPLLGISQHIHNTIYAWIHFRQFAVTGECCLGLRCIKLYSNPLAQMSCTQLACVLALLKQLQTTSGFDHATSAACNPRWKGIVAGTDVTHSCSSTLQC